MLIVCAAKHDGVRLGRWDGARWTAAGRDPHREPSVFQSPVQAGVRARRGRSSGARAAAAAAGPWPRGGGDALGRGAALRRRGSRGLGTGPPGGGGGAPAQETAQAQGGDRPRVRGPAAGGAEHAQRRRGRGDLERGGADRRAGGARGPRDAGARGAGPGGGPHRAARCAGGGRGRGRGAGAGAARGRAGPPQAGGGAACGRRAGGRAAAGSGSRATGGSGGHHRRAGPPAHPSRRVPRDARRGRSGRQAARFPGAGAAARGEHDRVQGQRRERDPDRDRDERRAREVPRAAREPGVTPFLVILCAPSGAGKTTIAQRLVRTRKDVGFSISATTRAPRRGELNGKAYYFISREKFEQLKRQDAFLECAQYAGEWYGTLKSEVTRLEARGRHVLLDIEVQGAAQIRAQYPPPASVSIFVLPPSPRALIQRLRRRESESADSLVRRLERAVSELREAPAFDYLVVNDKLVKAAGTVGKIIDAEQRRTERRHELNEQLDTLSHALESEAAALKARLPKAKPLQKV